MILIGLVLLIVGAILIFGFARGLARARFVAPSRGELIGMVISCAAAAFVSAALLVVPVYSSASSSMRVLPSGERVYSVWRGSKTLLEVDGPRALQPLAAPVLLAALPFAFYRTRFRAIVEAICGTLLAAFTVIGGFSIGLFYVPSAIAMLAAASRARRDRAFASPG